MVSLLNGHSKLFTIPTETHYFQYMHYWVDSEYRLQRPKRLTRDEIIESFVSQIEHTNISEDVRGGSLSQNIYNLDRFREKFSEMEEDDNDRRRLALYFESLHYAKTGKMLPEKLRVVEKSVENAEFAEDLSLRYPKAKFIHILRNPYANIVALRRYKGFEHGYPIMRRMIRSMCNSYYFLYRNGRTVRNYYVIRYCDLVSDPRTEMTKLCQFLEIPFEDILLTPTYDGELWQGNSTTGAIFSGIDASLLGKWKKDIAPVEVAYVNHLFSFILEDFGFDRFTVKGSFWKRVKGESLKRYLANRIYRYYLLEWGQREL